MDFYKQIICIFVTLFSTTVIFSQENSSWYKCYSGTIGNYPIAMHLHKAGHSYKGYYYYTKNQQLIYLSGDDTTTKGLVTLFAYSPGSDNNEQFSFNISGANVSGFWQKNEKSKELNVNGKEITRDSFLSFQYVYTQGKLKLKPNLKESPEATFEASSIWPSDSSQLGSFLKRTIINEFDSGAAMNEIGKILLNNKKKYFKGYLDDNKDLSDEDAKEDQRSYSSDLIEDVMIAFQSKHIITLAHSFYSYTGGMHGYHGTGYIPLDIINNKGLEIGDILTKAGVKLLPQLLAKYFKIEYGLKQTDSLQEGNLFENKIEPNENFYITNKGIGYCYTPYEIGPYSMGEIEIFIPFSELTTYLQAPFKQLIVE